MTEKKEHWGYHLVLDCFDADKDRIKDKANIELFAKMLVKAIDMVPFGEPEVLHFGSGDKEGYTLVQLIETSNITGHFSNDTGNFFLDIFSCKEFKTNTVLEVVKQFFSPKRIRVRELERG